jgi:hypothetical protein
MRNINLCPLVQPPKNGKRLSAFRRNQTKETGLKKVITLLMSVASHDNVEKN